MNSKMKAVCIAATSMKTAPASNRTPSELTGPIAGPAISAANSSPKRKVASPHNLVAIRSVALGQLSSAVRRFPSLRFLEASSSLFCTLVSTMSVARSVRLPQRPSEPAKKYPVTSGIPTNSRANTNLTSIIINNGGAVKVLRIFETTSFVLSS